MKTRQHFLLASTVAILGASPVLAQHVAPASGNPSCVENNTKHTNLYAKPLAASPQQTAYSHGDPTAEEQYILELVNRARANPKAEGERLANTTDPDVLGAYTFFKIDKELIKSQFEKYPSRPPLAFHPMLIASSRKHSEWMKANNIQSHTGANGSSPFDRMNTEGYKGWTSAGENISAYSRSLWYGHAGLNVDWGEQNQKDLGHRKNIQNFENTVFTEIGVGISRTNGGQNQVGPFVITQNFGKRSEYYITGVVYNDFNSNGICDVGEGLSGVTITPSKGNFYAVTSTSGGYAIPMTGTTGAVTLTATGDAFGSATKNVTVSAENVKVDFTSTGVADIISLISPSDKEVVESDSVHFSWRDGVNVTKYWFELSEKADFSTVLKRDSTITNEEYSFKNLSHGKTYYWRVKAANTNGWGEFSGARSFTVQLQLPARVELVSPENNSAQGPNPILKWRSVENTTSYWIEVSKFDTTFSEVVVRDSNLTTTSYQGQEAVFTKDGGGVFFWRIRAKNDAGWGEFSQVWNFSVIGGSIYENAALHFKLDNAPNPFEKTTNITFTLLKDQNVTLRIYNAAGQQVFTTHLKDAREG
ncbi:MAG TPA: CAP domain-containing protein, partial [Patescibacteria group bacterium]|nr:CAP domain-containing protein [Patescibacteria group bacterium]